MDTNDSGRHDGHDGTAPDRDGTTSDRAGVQDAYPRGELARAFLTAVTHQDPKVRRSAEERVDRWREVLAGMADGTLAIGSRTPVNGLPAWVTPQGSCR
ncbi:hypothetical protein [Actinacidiphila acidipaludis]|uniref:Uncharacterized protein n=1 Tax=Actinacidiphila acidipaludis TaxID=2873382 RepID=A0ABS7Q699_9ACTN|nr:hypothetical protein [Streptomyces acidipaludis]MBY8878269.1 hypothetical protein [Streptomyces acidipaludis]